MDIRSKCSKKVSLHTCNTAGMLCASDWEFACLTEDEVEAELRKDYNGSSCFLAAMGMCGSIPKPSKMASNTRFRLLLKGACRLW